MIEHPLTRECEPDPRFVVVVIEDETLQAMWCVALESLGFHPIAAADDHEAMELAAVLPANPLAIITCCEDPRERPHGRLTRLMRSRRGSPPPTLVLERPPPASGEPARVRQLPDFAEALEALQQLSVG